MHNIEHQREIIYKTKTEWSFFLWAKHENYDDIELKTCFKYCVISIKLLNGILAFFLSFIRDYPPVAGSMRCSLVATVPAEWCLRPEDPAAALEW